MERRQRAIGAGAGPTSTTTAAEGPVRNTIPSPWPTSHSTYRHRGSGHPPTDTGATQAAAIAKDMLHLADTKILHGQDQGVAEELQALLGLPDLAVHIVTDWCRQAPGRALWIVGENLYKVATILHPAERQIAFTNQAIIEARS